MSCSWFDIYEEADSLQISITSNSKTLILLQEENVISLYRFSWFIWSQKKNKEKVIA